MDADQFIFGGTETDGDPTRVAEIAITDFLDVLGSPTLLLAKLELIAKQ